VFMLLSGIVIETGGVLSHAVCLSREYGLPAVQLKGARKSIPDGATITINGATGEVTVLDDTPDGPDADAATAVATNGHGADHVDALAGSAAA
jgi:phosphoenolpyruvate-protein kinase (PTS system EI component)